MGQGWLQLVAEPAEGAWELGFHRLWADLPWARGTEHPCCLLPRDGRASVLGAFGSSTGIFGAGDFSLLWGEGAELLKWQQGYI